MKFHMSTRPNESSGDTLSAIYPWLSMRMRLVGGRGSGLITFHMTTYRSLNPRPHQLRHDSASARALSPKSPLFAPIP